MISWGQDCWNTGSRSGFLSGSWIARSVRIHCIIYSLYSFVHSSGRGGGFESPSAPSNSRPTYVSKVWWFFCISVLLMDVFNMLNFCEQVSCWRDGSDAGYSRLTPTLRIQERTPFLPCLPYGTLLISYLLFTFWETVALNFFLVMRCWVLY
jgi:hypothetical protein